MSDLFGHDELPVITLWQPWASLIFTGDKKHETRSFRFPAKYAGRRVAIHAAKRPIGPLTVGMSMLCCQNWGHFFKRDLPLGAIIGTVTLVEALPTDDAKPDVLDRICGDWSPGRFAWRLDDVRALPKPIPAKGKQGWWKIAAQVGRNPEGGDAKQGSVEDEHAVGATSADAPNPHPLSQDISKP
jgi:hypothetical protein